MVGSDNVRTRHVLRTALFVDFDNIYSGLRGLDPAAADVFARDPQRWLRWLQTSPLSASSPGGDSGAPQRSMLIRRCYLNPNAFAQFRPFFVRSGFQVVDCPSYTGSGKNGADIQMVMDVLDTLEHKTYFDEFMLLSGDSDFTPLLYRLRAHERHTVVLALGMSAAAYRSAADVVLPEGTFIERGLLAEPDQADTVSPVVAPVPADRARSMKAPKPTVISGAACAGKDARPASSQQPEQSLYEKVRNEAALYTGNLVMGSDEPVSAGSLASQLRNHFGERIDSKWNGAGTFKAFVGGLPPVPGHRFSVSWAVPGWFYDLRRHTLPADPKLVVHSIESDGQPSS